MSRFATVDHPSTNRRSIGLPFEADTRWKSLYGLAGVASAITVLLILAAVVAHVVWTPPDWSPGAAVDWFDRFQDSWLLGLLGLDFLIVISLVLGVPIFLALYTILHHTGESAMATATAFALLGTALHLTSNTAFEMLALSGGYATATTDAERAMFLAAGEAALAAYYGTAFHVSYVLGYVAKLIIGAVMLRSSIFNRATAYLGILVGIVGLGFYIPTIGLLLSILSVLFLAVWYSMITVRLLRLWQSL